MSIRMDVFEARTVAAGQEQERICGLIEVRREKYLAAGLDYEACILFDVIELIRGDVCDRWEAR